jgi:hypothetical protein
LYNIDKVKNQCSTGRAFIACISDRSSVYRECFRAAQETSSSTEMGKVHEYVICRKEKKKNNKYIKECSTLLVAREVQIKGTI